MESETFMVYWVEEDRLCKALVAGETQGEADNNIFSRLKDRKVNGRILSEFEYEKLLSATAKELAKESGMDDKDEVPALKEKDEIKEIDIEPKKRGRKAKK